MSISANRLPDWEARLISHLEKTSALHFEYGTHDCCVFSSGAVTAVCGQSPIDPFIGKYKSAASAVRAYREAGFETLDQLLDSLFTQCHKSAAHTGDLAWHNHSVGVIYNGYGVFATDVGFARCPMSDIEKTWMVGRDG